MEELINRYAARLVQAEIAPEGAPLMGFLDADLVWNRDDPACKVLSPLFDELNINSLLFSRPAEPYYTIIEYLASVSSGVIFPKDCETRTFMHDLPVADEFTITAIARILKKRKIAIIPGHGIISFGTVSPEQAFITFSSVCFASFVKFFSDFLADSRAGVVKIRQKEVFEKVSSVLDKKKSIDQHGLMAGPFSDEGQIIQAMDEAGKRTVELDLVDSFFGNISCRFRDSIYISQTTSSLDALPGCIDICPLDNSSSIVITASSELSAHREAILRTGCRTVLHGHPRFAVIMSMDCEKTRCEFNKECFRSCPETRYIDNIPIVPGEVGTGKYGLCRTIPPALEQNGAAIVYGHGVFTVGKEDFNGPVDRLLEIENLCRKKYFEKIDN
jgi:ribulose-5-phosphate 4-epimerase/fuculose-1-phosphate aldolase